MSLIDEALKQTTDTKACVIRAGATEDAAKMFKELFPEARKAIIVEDPRTRQVAGARVEELLVAAGVECDRHVLCPGGEWFMPSTSGLTRCARRSARPAACRWPWDPARSTTS